MSNKEEVMKVIILKQTVAAKKDVRVGDEIELPKSEAMYLIRTKKAAEYSKELAAELGGEKKPEVKESAKSKKKKEDPPPAE